MTLALTPHNRLAAPTGSVSIAPVPPSPPSLDEILTTFGEPTDKAPPGYLVVARDDAEQHPDSAAALARLAQAEESATELAGALRSAAEALELAVNNSDIGAAFAASQLLLSAGAAEVPYRLLRGVSVDNPLADIFARAALACGDRSAAERVLTGRSSLDALGLLGWLALEDRKPEKAIGLLRHALRCHEATPVILTNLGFAHALVGQLKSAIKETRQAFVLLPADRTIAFNLVGFLAAAGSQAEALSVLSTVEAIYPNDVSIALVRADVFLRFGDRQSAHRVLQRARTSTGITHASRTERAELDANLGFLRWLTGRWSIEAVREEVLAQLAKVNYESLPIAGLLPALLQHAEDVSVIEHVLPRLDAIYPPEELFFLRTHGAILRRDSEEAVKLAQAWAEHDRLNPIAASIAVQLTAELAGDMSGAIELGLQALSRAPTDVALINNLAYILARTGALGQARKLLDRVPIENHVALTATRALVELMSGNIEAGLAGYRDAHALAMKRKHYVLAWLVDAYCKLALHQLDAGLVEASGGSIADAIEVPKSAEGDINVWILRRRAEREALSLVLADAETTPSTEPCLPPERRTRPNKRRR